MQQLDVAATSTEGAMGAILRRLFVLVRRGRSGPKRAEQKRQAYRAGATRRGGSSQSGGGTMAADPAGFGPFGWDQKGPRGKSYRSGRAASRHGAMRGGLEGCQRGERRSDH